MPRNKSFWIAVFLLGTFIVAWIIEGFGAAILSMVVVLILLGLIFSKPRNRRKYDDDETIERRQRTDNVTVVEHRYYEERQCPDCCGTGKVEWGSRASGMPLITRGAPGSSKYIRCRKCKGSGVIKSSY
jgi:hypothetical protein